MGRMIDMTLMEKKTLRNKLQQNADQIQHFGLRKLSIGVTSVLLSTFTLVQPMQMLYKLVLYKLRN